MVCLFLFEGGETMEVNTFSIADFFIKNPNANKQDVFIHFAKELEVDKNVQFLKNEVSFTHSLNSELRPLVLKRKEIEEKMKEVMQMIEVDVAIAYPPRQGTDKERDSLRSRLKKENEVYQDYDKQYRVLQENIFNLELQLDEILTQCKNARRMTEMFDRILEYISKF